VKLDVYEHLAQINAGLIKRPGALPLCESTSVPPGGAARFASLSKETRQRPVPTFSA